MRRVDARWAGNPVPAPFLFLSFPLSGSPGQSPAHFSYLFVRSYKRYQSLEILSPIRESKTLFLTQSSLPLVQLWSGRLRLDGFESDLNMQNVQLGPSGLAVCWTIVLSD